MNVSSGKKTILIVEDTPEHIEILIQCLRDEYANVLCWDVQSGKRHRTLDDLEPIFADIPIPTNRLRALCRRVQRSLERLAGPMLALQVRAN